VRCEEFEQLVQRLLDERKPLDACRNALGHADGCRRCRATLDAYQKLWDGLELLEPPALDPGFAERAVAAVPLVQPRFAARRWFVWASIAVAASLLIVVAATWRSHRSGQPDSARPAGDSSPSDLAVQPPGLAPGHHQPRGVPDRDRAQSPHGGRPLEAIFERLADELAADRMATVDRFAVGLRPIRESLATAIDVLWTTIPIRPKEESDRQSGDSASFLHRASNPRTA
jgi:hypothetical protein